MSTELKTTTEQSETEVVELLDVRVIVSDIVEGRPGSITIHGVLDPSMFLSSDVSERKPSEPECSSPATSGSDSIWEEEQPFELVAVRRRAERRIRF